MQPIQIDIIGFQPAQRIFERAIDMFATVAARVRIAMFGVETEFRGDYQLVTQAAFGNKFAD